MLHHFLLTIDPDKYVNMLYNSTGGGFCYKVSCSIVLQMFFIEGRLAWGRNDHIQFLWDEEIIFIYFWLRTSYSATLSWNYGIELLLVEGLVSSCSWLKTFHSATLCWKKRYANIISSYSWLKTLHPATLGWKKIS